MSPRLLVLLVLCLPLPAAALGLSIVPSVPYAAISQPFDVRVTVTTDSPTSSVWARLEWTWCYAEGISAEQVIAPDWIPGALTLVNDIHLLGNWAEVIDQTGPETSGVFTGTLRLSLSFPESTILEGWGVINGASVRTSLVTNFAPGPNGGGEYVHWFPASVPEPGTAGLTALGLLLFARRRRGASTTTRRV